MAPVGTTLDAGYPLYAAQFAGDMLIVAGGGGEGKNGIPNKLSAVAVDLSGATPLKITGEHVFKEAIDSPTALAYAKETLLVAANEGEQKVKNGDNKALRQFFYKSNPEKEDADIFAEASATDVFKSTDHNEYIKLLAIATDASVAAVVSSSAASTLKLINPETLEVVETLEEDKEIKDVAISPDGKKVAFVTDQTLTVLQDGEELTLTYNKFTSNYTLTKVVFASDTNLIVGVNLKNKAGVLLLESIITKDDETGEQILKTIKARVFSSNFQKITGLDVSKDLIAVVGNDNSITIVSLKNFSVCKRLEKVHTFATTKVLFTPDGKGIVSVSAASTINLYKIPENILVSYANHYWSLFFLLLSIFFYWVYENVPREKFLAVTEFLDSLVDEGFAPLNVDTTEDITTTETVHEPHTTAIVVQEKVVIDDDQVKVETTSYVVDEELLEQKVKEKVSASLL